MAQYDIAVVGGGLVGLSFALSTIKRNPKIKIIVLEQYEPDFANNNIGYDNKIYAISPKNINKLNQCGIYLEDSRVGNINQMSVYGTSSKIEFNRNDCNNQYLAKIVEYRNLLSAIYDELGKYNQVELCYGKISQINFSDDLFTIVSDSKQIIANWLVASDGANSFVRRQFDFKIEEIPYYQSGVVANFKCEKPHNNTAFQWFLEDSILAYLPLPDNQISIVWSNDKVNELLNMSTDDFCNEVALASDNRLGKLDIITKPVAFPLKLNLVDKFVRDRVILIGDAAHTVHPLAGQGVNLGFGDAWELSDIMAVTNARPDSADLLRFNASRMIEVRKMQITCHTLHRLFHNRNSVINLVRNFGLSLVNKAGIVKKMLINSAVNY